MVLVIFQPLSEASAEELIVVIPHILYRMTLCLSILIKGVHMTLLKKGSKPNRYWAQYLLGRPLVGQMY